MAAALLVFVGVLVGVLDARLVDMSVGMGRAVVGILVLVLVHYVLVVVIDMRVRMGYVTVGVRELAGEFVGNVVPFASTSSLARGLR